MIRSYAITKIVHVMIRKISKEVLQLKDRNVQYNKVSNNTIVIVAKISKVVIQFKDRKDQTIVIDNKDRTFKTYKYNFYYRSDYENVYGSFRYIL